MDVLMPQLGETVTEGKITRWFRSAGDQVAPGDNLFEIETDKVSMEVPSTTAGVLAQILVPAGEVAPVWAQVPLAELVKSWDGARVPKHWARVKGVDHFFNLFSELNDFLELQKAALRGREELRVYEGPDSATPREKKNTT